MQTRTRNRFPAGVLLSPTDKNLRFGTCRGG